ncbi:hypothetical protein MSAN_02480000 [Mycena sanguinolenta]|uniref:Uncharacterized protein n=1 Tax=Mycena sanguinolenta TaxID=230812 RepID=A0A8H6WSY2_9AGAR|nr:hypothetical protein MSAN_02480000 [Mycena sanguinolenta]
MVRKAASTEIQERLLSTTHNAPLSNSTSTHALVILILFVDPLAEIHLGITYISRFGVFWYPVQSPSLSLSLRTSTSAEVRVARPHTDLILPPPFTLTTSTILFSARTRARSL